MDVDYLRSEFRNVLIRENLDVKTGEDIIYAEQVATNGYGIPSDVYKANCKTHYGILESANFLKMRQDIGPDQTGMNDFRRSIVQERLKSRRKDIEMILSSNHGGRTYIILFGTLGNFSLSGRNNEFLHVNDNITLFGQYGSYSHVSLYQIYSELLCCGKLKNIPKITENTHQIFRRICQYAPQDVISFYEEFERIGIGIDFSSHNTSRNANFRHVIPLYEMLLHDNLLSFVPPPDIRNKINELLTWDFISCHPDLYRANFSTFPDVSTIAPFISNTKRNGLTSDLLPKFSDRIANVPDASKLRAYCEGKASEIAHELLASKERVF